MAQFLISLWYCNFKQVSMHILEHIQVARRCFVGNIQNNIDTQFHSSTYRELENFIIPKMLNKPAIYNIGIQKLHICVHTFPHHKQ